MARKNGVFKHEKRQKELAKQRKKQQKLAKKRQRAAEKNPSEDQQNGEWEDEPDNGVASED